MVLIPRRYASRSTLLSLLFSLRALLLSLRALLPSLRALLPSLRALLLFSPVLGLPACDPGSSQGEIALCVCDEVGCSASSCPLTITLDSTCSGEMQFAEVLVDDHVEGAPLEPLVPLLTCSRIEPGAQATLWVRGGPWVWGPLVERCDVAGENQQIVLQCVEAR